VLALALAADCVARLGGVVVARARFAFLVRIVRVRLEGKIGTARVSGGSALWFVANFDPVGFVFCRDRSISFTRSFQLDAVKKTQSREIQLDGSQVVEHGDKGHGIESRFKDALVKSHVVFVRIRLLERARKLRLLPRNADSDETETSRSDKLAIFNR
jgi:hypothetical protein